MAAEMKVSQVRLVVKGFVLVALMAVPILLPAQDSARKVIVDRQMILSGIQVGPQVSQLEKAIPLFSFEADNKYYTADNPGDKIECQLAFKDTAAAFITGLLTFRNISPDTVVLRNIMPLVKERAEVCITGWGTHELSRTHLFLPGKVPVNVIVPDNAWDLGYSSIAYANNNKIALLTRRDRSSIVKGQRTRFETILYPGGTVRYKLYIEHFSGDWQNGLVKIFQQRMLYDLPGFDSSLYQRKDLQWIRHAYVQHLMYAWDKFYFDAEDGKYHLREFLERGKKLYGGDDIVSIWPTWPTLGLDQRNQFDLFRDLPGGTTAMRKQADISRKLGARFFICYNPWDGSTRAEDHYAGLTDLIRSTSADGVVLDTKGESSRELQQAADIVRPGVVMYSEGMAVPRDMPGIVSGRVHNALYYPPMLNLNKLIKPSFAIFRVAELYKEKIRREFATSFFNGYGTEMNIMAPGQPDWADEQYRYLGRTSRILRENADNFTANGLKPLVPVTADSIWVNEWITATKTVYTIYSVQPAGYKGELFEVTPAGNTHFVDLWHHRLLTPKQVGGKWLIEAQTDAFNASDLGTNNEGEVDCIARLPNLIRAELNGNDLNIVTNGDATELRVWAGKPTYEKQPVLLKPGLQKLRVDQHFGRFEGDLVIQLVKEGILLDEQIVQIIPGSARRISVVLPTEKTTLAPKGMVHIPAGKFTFKVANGDEFIGYPKQDVDSTFNMPSCFMDRFPVTNRQYRQFLQATHYRPADTANFLKHWKGQRIPAGEEDFPVVYISYEDAKAYATWAKKRLPTEIEWQYAAQTASLREWPWDQKNPVVRRDEVVNATLTVTKLEGIDTGVCNLGNGRNYKVGSYPKGANPFGLQDLVGCVWQLTNDQYMSGSHRYIIMKGGSFFKPSSSWWYVQGGPKELYYRQYLLRVSQGFERNATVGFRCLKDSE
ncbi:formylglycine-generating enzyme family protein [Flavihumibacter fluvii]|uniref:formylglycine-generating enzyme family protein n=1 Tax=Flavihumibacter fluvii TaxID=2838157 RepID=UPI001BDEB094|nr:SUMF1/EgtB/PvdO family nonheme iron enzyme [Flavihumibacter fluvii]ULQ51857.1 formylglycine-generating enzyme family protein [Flavihumibacter fluvii]